VKLVQPLVGTTFARSAEAEISVALDGFDFEKHKDEVEVRMRIDDSDEQDFDVTRHFPNVKISGLEVGAHLVQVMLLDKKDRRVVGVGGVNVGIVGGADEKIFNENAILVKRDGGEIGGEATWINIGDMSNGELLRALDESASVLYPSSRELIMDVVQNRLTNMRGQRTDF
jgi:hypothetical protein